MLLLVFEFLGTTELLVIALVALIIFGPRKLPEIGRTIGRSLADFKRASEDFKRTWEYEVEMEQRPADSRAARDTQVARGQLLEEGAPGEAAAAVPAPEPGAASLVEEERAIARGASAADAPAETAIPFPDSQAPVAESADADGKLSGRTP